MIKLISLIRISILIIINIIVKKSEIIDDRYMSVVKHAYIGEVVRNALGPLTWNASIKCNSRQSSKNKDRVMTSSV